MIVTRPVRFTGSMAAHRRLFEALGAQCLSDHGDWVVYGFDHGRIALHTADETYPAGLTTLGFETNDLDACAAAAAGATPPGVSIAVEDAPHGRAVVVRSPDGITFTVDPLTPQPSRFDPPVVASQPAPVNAPLSVTPLWFTAETSSAAGTLTALGALPRIESDRGGWTDLRTDCGLVAVHESNSADTAPDGPSAPAAWTSLGFEFAGDLDDLVEPLRQAGLEATVIDESYGRSLRLPDPDLPTEQIWINEEQRDLYGYRRLGAPPRTGDVPASAQR